MALEIRIVGAGLAGLTAAIACAQAGHHVTVLESAPELAEIGAGLQITPNASLILKELGVYDVLEPLAAEPSLLQVRRYSDGKVLSRTESFDKEMRRKYGAPFWDLHRADLQIALAKRASELGVKMRLNARVSDVDFNKASLTLADGEEIRGDLIVAADGLWSKCREIFLARQERADKPLPTGDLAYRILLKRDQVQDGELRDWISNPSCQFWIGPNSHVVAYSVRGGEMFNIVLLTPDDLPPEVTRSKGSLEEMRAIFSNWDPTLNRFLDQVTSVEKWKLLHRSKLDTWVNDKSNCVFIGDSCHPMLPYLAQGANSSIEDGYVLGGLLADVREKRELPTLLQLYERLRKERGEAIARETFAQRADFHMCDGPEQENRDALMTSTLGKEVGFKFPSRWQCPEVQPWLYGYDAVREVQSALNGER